MSKETSQNGQPSTIPGFDEYQLKILIKEAFSEHISTVGCAPANKECPFSSDDLYLIHKFVNTWNSATKIVGSAILIGVLSGIGWLAKIGIEAWRTAGGNTP